MNNDSNDNANFLLALLIILIFFVLLMGSETSKIKSSTNITNSIQVEASSGSSSTFRAQPSDHPIIQENSVPTKEGGVSCPMVLSRDRLEKCMRGEAY